MGHKFTKLVANSAAAVGGLRPSVNLNNETIDDSTTEIRESAKRGLRASRKSIVRIPDVYEKDKMKAAGERLRAAT